MSLFKRLRRNKKQQDEVLTAVKEVRTVSVSEKYDSGMKKSRESFTKKIQSLITKHREVNEEYFKELEEVLIMSDVGVAYVMKLVEDLKTQARIKNVTSPEEMNEMIFSYLFEKYLDGEEDTTKLNIAEDRMSVFLVIGVNGVGKTTSIGKLTKKLVDEGKKVHMVAADTFRAGAVQQLVEWSKRVGVEITTPEQEGQDPASVVYKGIETAKANGADVLLIDTAGRLQNKSNLMKELEKVYGIIQKLTENPADETLLVLDATTGQNGVSQAAAFNEVAKLTGIILTKMDSSSKGGIILSIKDSFNVPVKYIGLGEALEDLEQFDIKEYLYALTSEMVEEADE